MVDVVFQTAQVADADALLDVQIRSFHDDARLYPGVEKGGPPGYDSLEQTIKDIGSQIFYAFIYEGQIVGGVVLFDHGEGHMHVDRLFVDPDFHNMGIGTQAIHFIEAAYPANTWTLDTPLYATRNQHFYEKLGYVNVGITHDDDIDLIQYKKVMTN